MNEIKAIISNGWFHLFGARGKYKILKDQTALVIRNELNVDDCNSIKKVIDRTLANSDGSLVWVDPEGADMRIFEYEKIDVGVRDKLKVNERIKNIEDYTGRKINSWLLMAARIHATDNNVGSGGGWHKDSAFSHQVKCIWYLSNVDEMNGPFQYVCGTNKIKKYTNHKLEETRFKLVTDGVETVSGNAGDLLICDTLCVHRGKPVESGVRYAITLYTFHSKKAKLKMLNDIRA